MAFNKKIIFPAQEASVQTTDRTLYSFSYGLPSPDSFALFRLTSSGAGTNIVNPIYDTLNKAAAGPDPFSGASHRVAAFNFRDDDNIVLDLVGVGYFAIVGQGFSCLVAIAALGHGPDATFYLPPGRQYSDKYSAGYTLKAITGGDVVLTGKKVKMVIASRNDWEAEKLPEGIQNIPALLELTVWGERQALDAQQEFVLVQEDDTARSLSESRQFRFRNQVALYNRAKFIHDGLEFSVTRYELSRDERFVTITGNRVITTA